MVWFFLGVVLAIQIFSIGLRFGRFRGFIKYLIEQVGLDEIYFNREYADPRRKKEKPTDNPPPAS